MKNKVKLFACSLLMSCFVAGGSVGAIPNTFTLPPSPPNPAPNPNFGDLNIDGQTQRRPFTMQPSSPLQLGPTWGISSGNPLSNKVYNFFKPFFTPAYSAPFSGTPHFNYPLYQGAILGDPNLGILRNGGGFGASAFTLQASPDVTTPFQVFFIDRNPNLSNYGNPNTNTHALGFADLSGATPGTHPLTGLSSSPNLLFPYVREATENLPNLSGDDLGRFVNNPIPGASWTPALQANEHPLLLADYAEFNLPAGGEANLFLMTDTGDLNTDFPPTAATSAQNVWASDPAYNWETVSNELPAFQHFRMYEIPALQEEFYTYYLAAVESQGVNNALGDGLYDFNDLFFLVRAYAPVPEPTTYLLIGSLLLVAFFIGRKQKREVTA